MPLWCGENNDLYLNHDVAGPLCHCDAVKTIIHISTMVKQALYATVMRWKQSSLSQPWCSKPFMPLWCGENNHLYLNHGVAGLLCHCDAVKTIISISAIMLQALYATVMRWKQSSLPQPWCCRPFMPLWCGENNHLYLNHGVAGPLCHCDAVKTMIFISTMV